MPKTKSIRLPSVGHSRMTQFLRLQIRKFPTLIAWGNLPPTRLLFFLDWSKQDIAGIIGAAMSLGITHSNDIEWLDGLACDTIDTGYPAHVTITIPSPILPNPGARWFVLESPATASPFRYSLRAVSSIQSPVADIRAEAANGTTPTTSRLSL